MSREQRLNNGQQQTTSTPSTTTGSIGDAPRLAIPDSPMATAPTSCHTRPSLPSPNRTVADEAAEGSLSKQQRTTEAPTGPAKPEPTTEPPKSKLRITNGNNTNKERGRNHSIYM